MAANACFIRPTTGIARFDTQDGGVVTRCMSLIERLWSGNDRAGLSRAIRSLPETFAGAGLGVYHAVELWNSFAAMVREYAVPDGASDTPASAELRVPYMSYREILANHGSFRSLCAGLEAVCDKMRGGSAQTPVYSARSPQSPNTAFTAILREIHEKYHEKISVAELAKKHFINTSYCCELFKKETGYTFSGYVTRLRMKKARELLLSTNETIVGIAEQVGYRDYSYFCKAFHRFYGITPSGVRAAAIM